MKSTYFNIDPILSFFANFLTAKKRADGATIKSVIFKQVKCIVISLIDINSFQQAAYM